MSHIVVFAARAHGAPMLANGKRGRAIAAMVSGLLLASMAACSEAPAVPSALDVEAAQRLADMEKLHDRVERLGATRDLPALSSRKPANFAGVNLLCGRLAAPNGAYDRVIVAHGEAEHDGPTQGAWFDHVWRGAGCD